MSEWKARRSWARARVTPLGAEYRIDLDDRPARTPGGRELVLPTRRIADEVRAEWDAQQGEFQPETMPFTRLANVAIDRLGTARQDVVAAVSAYAESDLVCHRATGPCELVVRQGRLWSPVVEWLGAELGAPLATGCGVMPVRQSESSLQALSAEVGRLDAHVLCGFSEMVALSGSLAIGLAVLHGRLEPDAGWRAAMVDEHFQAEKWGVDADAAALEEHRRQGFVVACTYAISANDTGNGPARGV